MRFDLHMHTKYSKDCKTDLEEIIKAAKKSGLDGIAVTDHDTIKGGVETKKIARGGLEVIVGAEIMTTKREVIGYFISEEIKSTDFFEVIDEIKSQGGVSCIPHPFDYLRITSSMRPTKEILKTVDRVEVLNSKCVLSSFNRAARKAAMESGLGISAGSDAHTPFEIGNAGVIMDSADDLRNKKDLETFGSRTPFMNLVKTKIIKTMKSGR